MRERVRLHRQPAHYPSLRAQEDDRKRNPGAQALMEPGLFSDAAQALPESVRRPFEEGYGHDFSQVRIHAGRDAGAAAAAMESRAYTAGQDIVFGPGEYAPDTAAGRTLLAHELGHVVQQRGAAPASDAGYQIHPTSDTHEQAAGMAASRVLAGNSVPALAQLGPGAHVQRWGWWLGGGVAPPAQKESPIAESERATRDYADALDYINEFYGDVIRCLDFAYEAESTAIGIFGRTTSTPDPPSMTKDVIMSIFNLGFTAVGGWSLIEKGLSKGIFAVNLWRMEKGLGEKLGADVVQALGKMSTRQRDAELAKNVLDLAKEGYGAGKTGKDAIGGKDTDAGRSTEVANKSAVKSLVNWGEKSSVAATEKEIAKANLAKIRDDPKLRGGLLNETRAALGDRPDAKAMGRLVQKVEERYELELYKARFGGDKGVYIQEIKGRMGTYSRILKGGGDSMDRVIARICEIHGWPKSQLRVGEWLGVPTKVQRVNESGRML